MEKVPEGDEGNEGERSGGPSVSIRSGQVGSRRMSVRSQSFSRASVAREGSLVLEILSGLLGDVANEDE